METQPTRDPQVKKAVRNATLSAIIGTAIEWYDYYLYATAAGIIFNKLFFPSFDSLTGTLLAYTTFAIGFFVRPLGSVIFGRLGDQIGRKTVMITTLLLMGCSTTAMGLLPTYASIGMLAPILLCVLRALQGLGSGAEYAGSVLMVIEYAPANRRGLYSSAPYMGVALGLLLSLATFHYSSELTKEQFEEWGWRVPFLVSAIVVMVGLIFRATLKETPVFEELKEKNARSKAPIKEVFRTSLRPLLCAWGARMGDNSLAYVYESFVIVYVTQQLKLPRDMIVTALMFSTAAQFVTVPGFGWLTDKIGRKPVYIVGAVLSGMSAFPFFWLLQTKNPVMIYAGLFLVSSIAKTMMTSAQSPWFAEMFPANVRYTGFALAREVTAPIAGGLAPIIAVALLSAGAGSPHLVGWYVVVLAVITAVSVLFGPETRGVSMGDESREHSSPVEPLTEPRRHAVAQ